MLMRGADEEAERVEVDARSSGNRHVTAISLALATCSGVA
jgi:hypothetical protein